MEFLASFWKFIVISAPFLLFGFFLAGVIKHFIPMSLVKKWLGNRSFSSIFKAALIGVPLPLCSCSVIPTAITLKKAGASNGATAAFVISTPESGIDSITMTYGMMDLPMTIIRPVAAFLSAMVAGIGQYLFNDTNEPIGDAPKSCCAHKAPIQVKPSCCAPKAPAPAAPSCCSGKHHHHKPTWFGLSILRTAYFELIEDIAFWMSIGLLAGAIIDYFVPADFLMMANGTMGRLLILGIGIPFYVCASASTPIAASMMLKGLSPGVALIFLLAGPATSSTNLFVMQKYIGKRGVLINVIAIAVVTLALSYGVDFLYSYFEWPLNFNIGNHHHHEDGIPWWKHASGVVLSLLLLRGLWKVEIAPRFFK